MKLDPGDTRPLLEILLESEAKVDAFDFGGQFPKSEIQQAVRELRNRRQRRAFIRLCVHTGIAAVFAVGAKLWLPTFLNGSSMMMLGSVAWLASVGATVYGLMQILRYLHNKE